MIESNTPNEILPILGEKEQDIRTHLIEFVHNLKYRIKSYVFYQDLSKACRLGLDMNNPGDRRDLGIFLDRVDIRMANECIDFWKDETNYNSFKHYPEEEEVYILRNILITAAASLKSLYYGDLVEKKDPYYMGLLIEKLNKLSEIENNAERPLLSAIVINKKTKLPGVDFWELCDTLNIKEKNWETIKDKCFDYWQKNKK